MEQNNHLGTEQGDKRPTHEKIDRYDNDPGMDEPLSDFGHDEYQARIERAWKHAAWRTEMALRLRDKGQHLARPESEF